jgi:uncharacterized protein (DUF1330 family)
MEHLIIVETDITNPIWVREYLDKVTPLVVSYGGTYITRSSTIELLEGDRKPQYVLVAKFSSKDSALAFYHSEAYAPYKTARQNGSSSNFLLVPLENLPVSAGL